MAKKNDDVIRVTSYKFVDVDKHIAMVVRDSGKLQVKIHSLAISILSHWALNPSDGQLCADKMTALQNASPYHANAFSQWVALKTGMQWSEEKSLWYVHADQKFQKGRLDSAKNEPFWVVSKPKAAKPLTDEMVLKMLEGILAKQQAHGEKPVEGDAFSFKANEHIRAAIKALTAE